MLFLGGCVLVSNKVFMLISLLVFFLGIICVLGEASTPHAEPQHKGGMNCLFLS